MKKQFNINFNQKYIHANEVASNKTEQVLGSNASNKTITKEEVKKNIQNIKE